LFLKWTLRLSKRGGAGSLIVVLAESQRTAAGRRHRSLGYLGSIKVDGQPWERRRFWRRVNIRLDRLALNRRTRREVVAAVAARIPPLEQDRDTWQKALSREDREQPQSPP
jgi:hypothetical protein